MADETREENAGLTDLVKETIQDVQELAKIEIALAKQEIRHDVGKLKNAAIAFGAATVAGLLGLSMLLVALLIAIGGGWLTAVALAAILLGMAIIAGTVGYRLIPREPTPERTVEHVEKQSKLLKERIA